MNRLEIKAALQRAILDSANLADGLEVLRDQHPGIPAGEQFAAALDAQRKITRGLLAMEKERGWGPPS